MGEELDEWLFSVTDIEMEMIKAIQVSGIIDKAGGSRICAIERRRRAVESQNQG